MKAAIITTTINVPHALRRWRESLNEASESYSDMIIVAGDYKSPHAEIEKFLGSLSGGAEVNRYLPPEAQHEWYISEVLGWNTIQRRNIALLEALKYKPDIIFTIDDDNLIVMPDHVETVCHALTDGNMIDHVITGSDGWFNIGKLVGVHHRGYPLSRRNDDSEIRSFKAVGADPGDIAPPKIGVHSSLWLGEPDIDAIERIAIAPTITEATNRITALAHGTWCPFNSQATAYVRQLAPLMMVWPGVGRYDDIWASYLARKVMDQFGYHVAYGAPVVRQERNPHDLLVDLQAELHGYRYTEELCTVLRDIDLNGATDVIHAMRMCYAQLVKMTYIVPTQTVEAFRAWDRDIEELITTFGVDFS